MRPPYLACLLCISALASSCLSKTDTWEVGAIPDQASFLALTPREHRRDSLMESHFRKRLASIADGKGFIVKYPDSLLRHFIQKEKENYQPHRDNRARFRNRSIRNGKPDPEGMFREPFVWETECSCYLTENGIIRVQAGQWVFGGFSLELELGKSGYLGGKFWEDQHERLVFKQALKDSALRDDVLVDNVEQRLVLSKAPSFSRGERVLGRMTFKTVPYFRSSEFQASFSKEGGDYSAAKMDTVRSAGTMDFVCQLKACAPADSLTRWNRANNPKWSNDPCR
jgi:hypothetical protein